ncbi:MAG TPA: YggS family pyridoxal phosphate-dependent enzyme [Enhygromyxa sp.]|nr:YggS family pyridoxal phosphate-dependent enzyme [Enhygromyxa sp.]
MTETIETIETTEAIADRLAAIRARIDAAVARRGPGPDVRLIGVGKRQPLDKLLAAHAAGLRDFGENYAQELRDKQREWPPELQARWHYIGALQANKLKYLVGKTALIHTVDRPELIAAIDERAARLGVVQDFLIEVALAGEQQKAGVSPERMPELLEVCARTRATRCRGLMIIPPAADDPEQTRPWFRELRQLAERLRERGPERPIVELRELSMGMSADFEVAIEEGATLVRVGTSIFGEREG